jgi:hypothetical protein
MAERAFASRQFSCEGRSLDRCEAAPAALDWAMTAAALSGGQRRSVICAGEQESGGFDR